MITISENTIKIFIFLVFISYIVVDESQRINRKAEFNKVIANCVTYGDMSNLFESTKRGDLAVVDLIRKEAKVRTKDLEVRKGNMKSYINDKLAVHEVVFEHILKK